MKFSVLDALSTTFVAMTIVFALLIILQYIIKLQSFIINFASKKSVNNKVDISYKEAEEIVEVQPKDDLEVVAVIAAALATYLDIPQSNLKIKSIKRIDNNSGWGISAIENNLRV
ncbi:OadG family protein [Clostridium tagluense]|uniref:OadG family protein n=1 Tax=Clostridium TaxID=1485 RepID=UPI0013E930BB|nr:MULTISPECIES: OadG family protein [Clostridium]MBU3129195.1 OadG family protein [Clostridium tagluense]MBW9156272.1 OadG family protein [Clostridium tagluense]MBZ9625738.1 OadG family protein [Clostridium sp. FP2]MCB2298063.1 OadG family protein [Clostridium tagluense]MCB2313871.1 OadG family protein [Clostridium tagluense]